MGHCDFSYVVNFTASFLQPWKGSPYQEATLLSRNSLVEARI